MNLVAPETNWSVKGEKLRFGANLGRGGGLCQIEIPISISDQATWINVP